jgi:hypothetical protein
MCKICGVHMGTHFQSANSLRIRLRSSLCESWKNLSMRDSNCWMKSVHLMSCNYLFVALIFYYWDSWGHRSLIYCCNMLCAHLVCFGRQKKQQYNCGSCGICRIRGHDNFFHHEHCGIYSLQLILKYVISGLLLFSCCCRIVSENEEVPSASKFVL